MKRSHHFLHAGLIVHVVLGSLNDGLVIGCVGTGRLPPLETTRCWTTGRMNDAVERVGRKMPRSTQPVLIEAASYTLRSEACGSFLHGQHHLVPDGPAQGILRNGQW